MFYVGQKVVCVDASVEGYGHGRLDHPHRLHEGEIYVVRKVGFSPQFGEDDILVLWLEGVTRINMFEQDVGYAAARFRHLVERKTDISIFTDMLKPKTERVSA